MAVVDLASQDLTNMTQFLCQYNIFYCVRRVKMASKDGLPSHSMVAMEWTPHQEECKVTEN